MSEIPSGYDEIAEAYREFRKRDIQLNTIQEPALIEAIRNRPVGALIDLVDLGCGAGGTTEVLANETNATRVVGVDLSRKMVALAQNIYRGDERLHFIRARGEVLPLPDDVASATVANMVLAAYPPTAEPNRPDASMRAAIAEMARVTAPGGIVAFTVMDPNFAHRRATDNSSRRLTGGSPYSRIGQEIAITWPGEKDEPASHASDYWYPVKGYEDAVGDANLELKYARGLPYPRETLEKNPRLRPFDFPHVLIVKAVKR